MLVIWTRTLLTRKRTRASAPGFEQQDKEKEYAAIFDQQKELRDELPAIQEDGSFKNPMDNNKTMTPSEVRTYVTKTRPLSNANDVPNIATIAETRALRMKKTAAGVPWAEDEKVAARSCFETSDLVIRPLMMELYAGDALRADERFKKGNGSLLIHHACGCNKHVRPLNSYSFSKRGSQRVYHGLSYTFVDYGQRNACDNPTCPVVQERYHAKAEKSEDFKLPDFSILTPGQVKEDEMSARFSRSTRRRRKRPTRHTHALWPRDGGYAQEGWLRPDRRRRPPLLRRNPGRASPPIRAAVLWQGSRPQLAVLLVRGATTGTAEGSIGDRASSALPNKRSQRAALQCSEPWPPWLAQARPARSRHLRHMRSAPTRRTFQRVQGLIPGQHGGPAPRRGRELRRHLPTRSQVAVGVARCVFIMATGGTSAAGTPSTVTDKSLEPAVEPRGSGSG